MTRSRREPPCTIQFLAKDGEVIETASLPGRRRPAGKAWLKTVPRADRRVVITCDSGHALAVVRRDGLVVARGEMPPGFAHSPKGWRPLISDEVGPNARLGPPMAGPLRLSCSDCGEQAYEVDAVDVPNDVPLGRVAGVSIARNSST